MIALWGYESILNLACGDSCTILWTYKNQWIVPLYLEWVNFAFVNYISIKMLKLLYHCYPGASFMYFFSTFCYKHLFLLNLLKTNSLRWNLHSIKFTCFKCIIQRFLVNLLSCAAITTILELSITPRRSLLSPLQSIFTLPPPSPWQPLMCFLSL